MNSECIDFVIPWVDGEDEFHNLKKLKFIGENQACVARESVQDHRWRHVGELQVCLRSIARNAPWVRKVWIIVDDQIPDLSSLPRDLIGKVHLVDHKVIFRGFEEFLPCFNSVSIGSMSWRIEGLSENYVYFNDDTFIARPTRENFFFDKGKLVFRGSWMRKSQVESFLTKTYRKNKFIAAKISGYQGGGFFSLAHVMQPMNKNMIEEFFERNPKHLINNIKHRFRSDDQFSISSLMVHIALVEGNAILKSKLACRNFSSTWCRRVSPLRARAELFFHKVIGTRFICVNDMRALSEKIGNFDNFILKYVE